MLANPAVLLEGQNLIFSILLLNNLERRKKK